MKGIELCADCAYYNTKSHKCTRGCKIEPDYYNIKSHKKGGDIHFFVDCPLPDVQPVKHGRWKHYKNNGIIDTYICTNCQGKVEMAIDVEPSKFKYCPNCGVRMDGEQDD